MFKFLLFVYLISAMVCLVSEVTVVMRSQANGFSIMEKQLFLTVMASILPIANIFTAYNNFVILFAPKEVFVAETYELRQSMDAMFDTIDEMKDDR